MDTSLMSGLHPEGSAAAGDFLCDGLKSGPSTDPDKGPGKVQNP